MDSNEIKLVINRQIRAPVEKVYAAWTNPELMKQWFAPDDMTVPDAQADARRGGSFMVHMHDPVEGSDHIVSGDYEEVVPNEKLVFSWMWKDGVDRTQVTVELRPKGENETLLTLTHRGFSRQEFADKHHEGWGGCLVNLGRFCGVEGSS